MPAGKMAHPQTVQQQNNEAGAADEFSLDDITATPVEPSREDIIAAAEAAAFSEES